MKTITTTIIGCMVLTIIAISAQAQFSNPEDAIQYRKSVMVLIVQHFKRMGAVVQGKTPYEKQDFADDAATLKILATLPWEASLEPGSDKGDTTLSASVFKDPDGFKKTAKAFEKETAELARLALAGDLEGSKTQFGVVAGNCKSCHSSFRTK